MLSILICLLGALYVVDGHAVAVYVDIPSFQAQPTPGDKIALLVGVRKYHSNSGIRALQYADKDMQRLQKVLEQHGYIVKLLVNEDATRGEILSALRFMRYRLKDPANSTMIFAFSGHGLALNEQNYLLTYDTYANDPGQLDIPDTALPLSQVTQLIRETGAKQQLMWLDACRNDLREDNLGIGIGKNVGMRAVSGTEAQGLMILFSSKEGTPSYEDNELQAGIFSHYLLQGLTGANGQTLDADGWIRMDKLRIYVENQVSTYALETRRVQVPYIGGEFHGQFWVGQVTPPSPPDQCTQPSPPASCQPDQEPSSGYKPKFPPDDSGFSLAKLEEQDSWETWQKNMQSRFDKTAAFQGSATTRREAWQVFLTIYAADNPYSQDDEQLRTTAQQQQAAIRDELVMVADPSPVVEADPSPVVENPTPESETQSPLGSYIARLSDRDHFNSSGDRLESVAEIIRQDRANYHTFNIRDNEDQFDSWFNDKDDRERLAGMLYRGFIDSETEKSILNGTPLILVKIYKDHIEVYLV